MSAPGPSSEDPATPSTPAALAAVGSGSFTTNETWLLASVFKHANNGIKAADVDWEAVLKDDGCPYTTKSSVTVTFNKLKRKLDGLRGGESSATGTPATPKTPAKSAGGRKKKVEPVGVDGSPTAKVTKPRAKRAPTIKSESLTAALIKDEREDGIKAEAGEKSEVAVGVDAPATPTKTPKKRARAPRGTPVKPRTPKKAAVKKEAEADLDIKMEDPQGVTNAEAPVAEAATGAKDSAEAEGPLLLAPTHFEGY